MEIITAYNIAIVIGVCIISIIIEMLLLPRIIYIAKKKKLFDIPDSRKIHGYAIPRLGGLSFTPVILIVTLLSFVLRFKLGVLGTDTSYVQKIPEVALFICGLLIIYLLGVKDDLVGMGFKKKFVVQFIASLCIVGSGTYINNLYGLLGIYEIPDVVGVIISVVIIIFTTNAINLIDGADGLASGVSGIALITYGVVFSIYNMWIYTCMAFIAIGVLIPFFYYNLFHPTRKIFMGDTGSLTLGFLLAFMILKICKYPPVVEIVPSGLILLIFSALFIPLFDAVKVMVVRMILGNGPFEPDRNHIHHGLMDLGLSKKRVVFVILIAAVVLILLNWGLLYLGVNPNLVLGIDLTIGVIATLSIYKAVRRRVSKSSVEGKPESIGNKFSKG